MSHAGPILCAAALLLGGCYDSHFRTEGKPSQPAAVTTTIARFNEALVGQTPAITGDIVLEGVVTTSDEAGNFYRINGVEFQFFIDSSDFDLDFCVSGKVPLVETPEH